ncbi:hypothetical protein FQA39_LY03320 [Lamprigera yunnana]|nr:hypothetical protein FQA39_LY03320 [Lamprigera yunnana]
MPSSAPQEQAPPYSREDNTSGPTFKDTDPPPPYNEINLQHQLNCQVPLIQNNTNYGTCPTAPPPPYTPSPSRLSAVPNNRSNKREYIPESGIMMPLNPVSSNLRPVEPSNSKKYAAYLCCAVFLVIIMFAAYLGRNSRKYHSHYRHNYDWS